MMARFYELEVSDIRQETDDCVSIELVVPEDLKEIFSFTQGQHLTFKKNINGQEIRRNYSLCTAPHENKLKVAVKKVKNGLFSTFANEFLKPGDFLESLPPMGRFFVPLDHTVPKTYLAFVSGSGITPIISNIKAILMGEPDSRFTLFYGNKGRKSIIFKEELDGLKNQYLSRFSYHQVFSREHLDAEFFNGHLDKEKLMHFNGILFDLNSTDEIFLCGPMLMMDELRQGLDELGFDKKKVHIELFTSPGLNDLAKGNVTKEPKARSIDSHVSVIIDGSTFQFEIHGNDTILDAASSQGADLPFACKGGVCCTCKARLVEGAVRMDSNFGLEQDEIDDGFVLTCQSHPETEKVVISYDDH